ncbi:hypothetical protein ASC96_29575 [Rhizobium sp. Root1204]|nr:hypothetical protein ASC96_29575 [Rhizobium sp. Root1204]
MKTGIVQYAALLVPVGLWGVTTQLGQILPSVDCNRNTALTLSASILAVIVSLSAVGAGARSSQSKDGYQESQFGILWWCGGLLFSFAVFLQGAAALLISPCER